MSVDALYPSISGAFVAVHVSSDVEVVIRIFLSDCVDVLDRSRPGSVLLIRIGVNIQIAHNDTARGTAEVSRRGDSSYQYFVCSFRVNLVVRPVGDGV